jgi:hypothetical protein
LIFPETGERERQGTDVTSIRSNNGKTPSMVYGRNDISHSNDEPPPTYELALKMVIKKCSLGEKLK